MDGINQIFPARFGKTAPLTFPTHCTNIGELVHGVHTSKACHAETMDFGETRPLFHIPKCSMYGLFTYIWLNLDEHVGKYTILVHGFYGYLDTWTPAAVNKNHTESFPGQRFWGTSSKNKGLQCCLFVFLANNTHTLREKKFQTAQAFWIDELRLKRILFN